MFPIIIIILGGKFTFMIFLIVVIVLFISMTESSFYDLLNKFTGTVVIIILTVLFLYGLIDFSDFLITHLGIPGPLSFLISVSIGFGFLFFFNLLLDKRIESKKKGYKKVEEGHKNSKRKPIQYNSVTEYINFLVKNIDKVENEYHDIVQRLSPIKLDSQKVVWFSKDNKFKVTLIFGEEDIDGFRGLLEIEKIEVIESTDKTRILYKREN